MKECFIDPLSEEVVARELHYILGHPEMSDSISGSVDQYLEEYHDANEIDKALAKICEKHNCYYYTTSTMEKIFLRQQKLLGRNHENPPLSVSVFFKADRITIPDPGIDEIQLAVTIASSAPREKFLEYLLSNKMIDKKRKILLEGKWVNGEIIGDEDWEEKLLFPLRVMVDSALESNQITYLANVTEEGKIAITENLIVKIAADFNYANFPFDCHNIPVKIFSQTGEDISVINIETDESIDTAWLSKITLPRGFKLDGYNQDVFAEFEDGYSPVHIFCPVFRIRRISETSVWRIFLPTFVIMAFVLTATGVSLIRSEYIESIMTSVLPGVLLASVALQLVAAQSVPAFSGRTIEDLVFLGHYLILFLSFISLLFSDNSISGVLFIMALAVFISLTIIYLVKSRVISFGYKGLKKLLKRGWNTETFT